MDKEIFGTVKDPRVMGRTKHLLEDVLRMALIGVICACDDYDEIHDFIKYHEAALKRRGLLSLPNGVPSADTIQRVMEAVDHSQIISALNACRGIIAGDLCGRLIIIDGKKAKGASPKSRGCNGLYILNAWVSETEICIGERRVDDKTNELTFLPIILASLWLTGTLVSIDAMGTHRKIAYQIIMQGGDYIIAA